MRQDVAPRAPGPTSRTGRPARRALTAEGEAFAERYGRQIIVEGVGLRGQARLAAASVAVAARPGAAVAAGACALHLAAAGVRRLVLDGVFESPYEPTPDKAAFEAALRARRADLEVVRGPAGTGDVRVDAGGGGVTEGAAAAAAAIARIVGVGASPVGPA